MALLAASDYYVLLEIFIFLAVAQLLHSITRRVGLPEIVADLVVGMALGAYAFGGVIDRYVGISLFGVNSGITLFADFAVVLLLFGAGLGVGFASLRRAGAPAVLAAIAGDLVPFVVVWAVASRIYPENAALLIALACAATSAAVAARLVHGRDLGRTDGAQFLVNVAALDDVVALLLLSGVLAALGGNFDLLRVTGGVASSLVGWVVVLVAAVVILPRVLNSEYLRGAEGLPFAAVFGLIAIVLALGFSPIIGAYIGGLAVAESRVAERTRALTAVLIAVFGSLFFIVVGAEFDVGRLTDPVLLGLALLFGLLAAVGKVAGVYPFARARLGSSEKARAVSLGMIPRGEIGLVVGALGLSLGILTQQMLGEILLMAIVTTLSGSLLFGRYASALGPPAPPRMDSPAA
jgi:Kef-type K+ transport system membrane component KefB